MCAPSLQWVSVLDACVQQCWVHLYSSAGCMCTAVLNACVLHVCESAPCSSHGVTRVTCCHMLLSHAAVTCCSCMLLHVVTCCRFTVLLLLHAVTRLHARMHGL